MEYCTHHRVGLVFEMGWYAYTVHKQAAIKPFAFLSCNNVTRFIKPYYEICIINIARKGVLLKPGAHLFFTPVKAWQVDLFNNNKKSGYFFYKELQTKHG